LTLTLKAKSKTEKKKNKNIFNNAIDTIRDDRKRKYSNSKEENKGKNEEETIRTVKIGEKNIIIKRKVKRERSREKIYVSNKYDLQTNNNNNNNISNKRFNKDRFNKGGYNNNYPKYKNQNYNNNNNFKKINSNIP